MKALLITLALASGPLLGCGQNITASDLPSLVQNSVKAKFPTATKLEWEKKGDAYEAEFDLDLVEYHALVDASGKIIAVKQELPVTELPAPIAQAVERAHKGDKIDDVEKIERDGRVYYQVEIEKTFRDAKKVYEASGSEASIAYWD